MRFEKTALNPSTTANKPSGLSTAWPQCNAEISGSLARLILIYRRLARLDMHLASEALGNICNRQSASQAA